MDDCVQALLVVVIGLLLFFGGMFVFLQAQHRWNVGRDQHLMDTCKLLKEEVQNSSTAKHYSCKQN